MRVSNRRFEGVSPTSGRKVPIKAMIPEILSVEGYRKVKVVTEQRKGAQEGRVVESDNDEVTEGGCSKYR